MRRRRPAPAPWEDVPMFDLPTAAPRPPATAGPTTLRPTCHVVAPAVGLTVDTTTRDDLAHALATPAITIERDTQPIRYVEDDNAPEGIRRRIGTINLHTADRIEALAAADLPADELPRIATAALHTLTHGAPTFTTTPATIAVYAPILMPDDPRDLEEHDA